MCAVVACNSLAGQSSGCLLSPVQQVLSSMQKPLHGFVPSGHPLPQFSPGGQVQAPPSLKQSKGRWQLSGSFVQHVPDHSTEQDIKV